MIDKLILGTVQLGLNYGVNNTSGKPSLETAFNILNLAYDSGIRTIDTAEAYGDSQEVIGRYIKQIPNKKFKIITKLSANKILNKGELIKHIKATCNILNVQCLEGYMFHNYQSFKNNSFLYQELLDAKKEGIINKAGISLYTNEEIEDIITNYKNFDYIQFPFNLLDNELKRRIIIEKAKNKGIEVHVRSTFLQGLFFKDLNTLENKLLPLKPYLQVLEQLKNKYQINTETLALQYVLQKKYIDKVLIGVDSVNQLQKNIDICTQSIEISFGTIDKINVKENKLLNPANWNSMKIVVITQARLGSTRLPNKVLKEIKGKSLLQIHIDRIKKAKLVDEIYIATTVSDRDTVIEELAKEFKVNCYRGSENDVLDRFYQTVKNDKADYVVRLTSDCPLIDPVLIDEVIEKAVALNVDYYSNGLEELYPDGQDIEIFKFKALEIAWKEAKLTSEREHVTPYIKNNSTFFGKSRFTSENYGIDFNYNNVRLTVDEPADFEVMEKIIEELGTNKSWKTYADFYLTNKEVLKLNNNIIRNEGYLKSLKQDKQ